MNGLEVGTPVKRIVAIIQGKDYWWSEALEWQWGWREVEKIKIYLQMVEMIDTVID